MEAAFPRRERCVYRASLPPVRVTNNWWSPHHLPAFRRTPLIMLAFVPAPTSNTLRRPAAGRSLLAGWRPRRPAAACRSVGKPPVRMAQAPPPPSTPPASSTSTAAAPPSSAAGPAAASSLPDRVARYLSRATAGDSSVGLARADEAWARLRSETPPPPPARVIFAGNDARPPVPAVDLAASVDAVIVGGTLGIFVGAALVKAGHSVAVVERGPLVGRAQEWNISRAELGVLVEQGLLTAEQLEAVIVSEYNPSRVAFPPVAAKGDGTAKPREVFVRDVLNVGVDPAGLIATVKEAFVTAGGVLLDYHAFERADVTEGGVDVGLRAVDRRSVVGAQGAGGGGTVDANGEDGAPDDGARVVRARLLIDAAGSFSPIAAQARGGARPDGVCVVVGSCAEAAWPSNEGGDLLVAMDDVDVAARAQYFWEAFPAATPAGTESPPAAGRSRRTTYMFAYLDTAPTRPSLAALFGTYLARMPAYQGLVPPDASAAEVDEALARVTPVRCLFGFFPSFAGASPLPATWDRVLHVGDASGVQSPISFGGFGALARHLPRLTAALGDVLADPTDGLVSAVCLRGVSPYLPSLSSTWLFQRAMSVPAAPAGAASPPTRGPSSASSPPPPSSTEGVPLPALLPPNLINDTLWRNMDSMWALGPTTLRPFLQDVVQWGALAQTVGRMGVTDPLLALRLTAFLGPVALVRWSGHFVALGAYAAADRLLGGAAAAAADRLPPDGRRRYWLRRWAEAWKWGSGRDYHGGGGE